MSFIYLVYNQGWNPSPHNGVSLLVPQKGQICDFNNVYMSKYVTYVHKRLWLTLGFLKKKKKTEIL